MVSFNTLDAFDRLVNAGVPKEQAEAHIRLLQDILEKEDDKNEKRKSDDSSGYFLFILVAALIFLFFLKS